ncbi:pentatricopeptide repeat-containing At5g66520-like [Olea europaea subsp. europaea]|uniref:Pentatricopeptide repeat-containing At5g66520-like n=1 Tax=Olea europaea subsp. europaea TaxID=158383 RepID=A0A8S0VBJ6_OLEEU|nr:pentatricopeptide repeat-containing At5g66520-like [Olea europaea subsp. europaea]
MSPFASKYSKSSYRTINLLNKTYLTTPQLKQIQSHFIISGAIADPFAAGKLIAKFAIFDLSHTQALFHFLPQRSTNIWNTMIKAFTENHRPENALSLYKKMLESNFLPNNYTFSFVFRACSELCDVSLGLMYHTHVVRLGWECYDFVQNGLIHCYASCKSMKVARKLFDVSTKRDVITWTALINGYLKIGEAGAAMELFDQMPERNAVSWSAMINGYVQMGFFNEALEIFNDMQVARIRLNQSGAVGLLSACASLGALDQGRWIHAYIDRVKMEVDTVLGTGLIDMYSKCGCIDMACHVFEKMSRRDVFAYTSIISGLANNGASKSAIELFRRMEDEGIRPNDVTLISVLNACSRMGLVEEGLRIFKSIRDVYGIEPGAQHYGCLVDLISRAGLLEQAINVVREMPMNPDSYVLGALLGACRVHGDIDLGREIVEGLAERCLDQSGIHVLLSNIYASINQWDDVERVRKGMEEKKVKKVPGFSLIEVDGSVFKFFAGDRSHDQMKEIEFTSLGIDKDLKSIQVDAGRFTIGQICQ